jgi:hypothetical protein
MILLPMSEQPCATICMSDVKAMASQLGGLVKLLVSRVDIPCGGQHHPGPQTGSERKQS